MSQRTALVATVCHRLILRRYIRLHIGAPENFTCEGGWHEAKAPIGHHHKGVKRGSAEERQLTPPRIDERWPIKCDRCDYEFTNRDRYQLLAIPVRELGE